MSGDSYRDAFVGIRARLEELEARILDREAEVTPTFWESVPHELRERLVQLREGRELTSADSFDELTRAEGMLAAYVDELDRLIAALPSVEEEWSVLPDDVDDPPGLALPLGYGGPTPEEASAVRRGLLAMVREHARDAEVTGDNPVYLARFRDRGCPFALRAILHTQGNGIVSEVSMYLMTSIPRALPPLVVRHEGLFSSIGAALGLSHGVQVGDPSFDGLFAVEGTRAAADLYLGPAVRAQLLVLSRFDVPTLHVDPASRTASLQWRFEPAPKALEAAVRVLDAVRECRPRVQFRRE
jgi:hypothetical protein